MAESSAADTVCLVARYHRILCAMRTRFGAVVEGSSDWPSFTWRDAVRTGEKLSRPALSYESACVLYNLAAALSYAGTVQDREEPKGMRAACQAFQHAAGALDALVALVGSASFESEGATLDLHPKALEAWRALMLGQAQQCFYEKAVADKMKDSVTAKIAAQAAASFQLGSAALRHKALRPHLEKWAAALEGQAALFGAWAERHRAAEHEAGYEYGAQVFPEPSLNLP